ncbi:MAG: hypothetical protein HLUCCO02_06775 [Idiomarinaceae bacterium HL-53]|nr:MAG: hypothetical protein HLUCCO02_06775 [Idiomarinaceae bacterium HL-53]CUS47329.1 hypothetical protein Ga0003345_0255 [Idiomarinaceae bacterium HL-53]
MAKEDVGAITIGIYVAEVAVFFGLIHIWHPLSTEELAFWPKLALMMLGQFTLVGVLVSTLVAAIRKGF